MKVIDRKRVEEAIITRKENPATSVTFNVKQLRKANISSLSCRTEANSDVLVDGQAVTVNNGKQRLWGSASNNKIQRRYKRFCRYQIQSMNIKMSEPQSIWLTIWWTYNMKSDPDIWLKNVYPLLQKKPAEIKLRASHKKPDEMCIRDRSSVLKTLARCTPMQPSDEVETVFDKKTSTI